MPIQAEVNISMQASTHTEFVTSEQHNDASKATVERDNEGTLEILRYSL